MVLTPRLLWTGICSRRVPYQADFGGDDAFRVGLGFEYGLSDAATLGAKIDYTNVSGGGDTVGASLNFNMRF